jgi:ABC-type multidrug transport system ATPase subunit
MVASQSAVYSLSLDKPVYVRAYVGESDLGRIAPGTAVRVKSDSSEKVYRGQIGFISPRAEFTPKTVETTDLRTDLVYRLRIVIDEADSDAALRQGMPVTIAVDAKAGTLARARGSVEMQATPAMAATPTSAAPKTPAVVIEGVDKHFGDVKALRSLSARIHYGRLTGLVGPDGAGKTTLMRILTGLLVPNAGHVTLAGYDVVKDNDAIHVASGYMPQRFGLYEDLSVMENMRLYAQLRGMDADRNADLFAELLDFTRLGPFTKRLAGKLSGGMKQKLGLACALMARPKVLLLDEPGVGVDPVSRQDLWRMVQALTDEGMAVVWSTAYLDEAERCESVLLLNEGQLLFDGPPQELTAQLEGRSFRLEDVGAERRAVLTQALDLPSVSDGVIQGAGVRVVLREGADAGQLQALSDQAQVRLARCLRASKTPSSICSVAAPAARRRWPSVCRRLSWVPTLPCRAETSPSASASSPPPTTSASRCKRAKSSACSAPTAPASPPPSRCCAAC